jgi:hypothetical protein
MNHNSFANSVERGDERQPLRKYEGHTPDWYEQSLKARKAHPACVWMNFWYAAATFVVCARKHEAR